MNTRMFTTKYTDARLILLYYHTSCVIEIIAYKISKYLAFIFAHDYLMN